MLNPNFFPNYKNSPYQNLKAALILLAVLIIIRFECFLNINSLYLGGADRDAGLYIWLSEVAFRDLFNGNFWNTWFDTKAFYPYTKTLAWSDNYIFPSLIYFILYKLKFSKVLAYNLILLSAQFLQGYFCYRLAFQLSGKALAATCSGVVFLSLAYFSTQLGHPQMQWAFFLPLSFSLAILCLKNNNLIYRLALSLCLFAAFLTSVYIVIYVVYALLLSALMLLILKPQKELFFQILKSGLVVSILLIPAVFFLEPYLEIKNIFGQRHLYEAAAFRLKFSDFFNYSKYHLLYGKILGSDNAEKALGIGFILWIILPKLLSKISNCKNLLPYRLSIFLFLSLLMATGLLTGAQYYQLYLLWALVVTYLVFLKKLGQNEKLLKTYFLSNRDIVAIAIGLIIFFLAFAMGPLAHKDDGILPLSPYSLAYYIFPGFSGLRASSRFVICIYFSLSILLAFYLPLAKYLKPKNYTYLFAFIFLILLENFISLYPLEPLEKEPVVVKAAADIAQESDVILLLPFTNKEIFKKTVASWSDYAFHNVRYMNWLSASRASILNGYSGQRSQIINTYPFRLKNFPDETSLQALREISNLHYIVVLADFIKDSVDFESNLEKFKEFKIVLKESGNYLLSFKPENQINKKEDFVLRVPSQPREAELDLEIKNISKAKTLSIYIDPYGMDKAIIIKELSFSNEWENLLIKIPTTPDSARPRLLRFETDQPEGILIGKRDFYVSNTR